MKAYSSIGRKYGRLTVLGISGKTKYGQALVLCSCECGKKIKTQLDYIRQGDTKSCGCLQKEHWKEINKTHGLSRTRFYGIYRAIWNRTHNPAVHNYHRYGGRGIKLLWKSFEEFHKDMYPSYLKHLSQHKRNATIERIRNNGNYCKSNCRWATWREQRMNQQKK